jgi:hypothetical protein
MTCVAVDSLQFHGALYPQFDGAAIVGLSGSAKASVRPEFVERLVRGAEAGKPVGLLVPHVVLHNFPTDTHHLMTFSLDVTSNFCISTTIRTRVPAAGKHLLQALVKPPLSTTEFPISDFPIFVTNAQKWPVAINRPCGELSVDISFVRNLPEQSREERAVLYQSLSSTDQLLPLAAWAHNTYFEALVQFVV